MEGVPQTEVSLRFIDNRPHPRNSEISYDAPLIQRAPDESTAKRIYHKG